jgi:hypothetical protein
MAAMIAFIFEHIQWRKDGHLMTDSPPATLGLSPTEVCHYINQPLVELYGGCMVVLKVS